MPQKPVTKKLAFEDRLLRIALVIGLLPTAILFWVLPSYPMPLPLKILILFFVVVIVLYCAFLIKQKVVNQLQTSTNLMEAMIQGDNSTRASYEHFDGALSEFNQLLNELSVALAEHKLVSREQHLLLHKVIAQIDVAILAVDQSSSISLMNPAAEALFQREFCDVEGWPVKELGLQQVIQGEFRKVVEFETKQHKKTVYLHTDEYFEKGVKQTLIFITDIQDLLREEERQAWQKLLRVLSHEINNSLTPIASIGESLSKLVDSEEDLNGIKADLAEGLAVITERSNSLDEFIQRYRDLTKLPEPSKTLINLRPFIQQTALLFEDLAVQIANDDLEVYADENQLQQVMVNLLKNAKEAMSDNPDGNVVIAWQKQRHKIEISIKDQGAGISNPDNLFVPFYTTKKSGTGIGIVLCRQIIMNHGGDLTITNRQDDMGAVATILLPSNKN